MQKLPLEIRPAKYPQDYTGIADVHNNTEDWHMDVADFVRHDRNREAKYHMQRFVAEVLYDNQKSIVGTVRIAHDDFFFEAGKYFIRIDVLPEYQNQGIASALYRTAQQHLSELGDAQKLQTMCNDYELPALHLLEKHGYEKVWERIESRLDPQSVDFTKYITLNQKLKEAGIEIFALSSFPADTRLKQLYNLDLELILDVPFGQAATPEPYEVWAKNFLEDPENNPETIWIAVKNNDWLAFSSLGKQKDHFYIGMTGVKKQYRGMGIAKALKLEGVRYALNSGLEIRTLNDHVNTAMLEMNFSMGFKRHHSRLRFEKVL
jgi:mycothiol synthase